MTLSEIKSCFRAFFTNENIQYLASFHALMFLRLYGCLFRWAWFCFLGFSFFSLFILLAAWFILPIYTLFFSVSRFFCLFSCLFIFLFACLLLFFISLFGWVVVGWSISQLSGFFFLGNLGKWALTLTYISNSYL